MSFLYELGINGFVQNIPDILHDPPDPQGKPGVVAGYIDDLYWAATFDEMVDVIRFVVERGPALWLQLEFEDVYLSNGSFYPEAFG